MAIWALSPLLLLLDPTLFGAVKPATSTGELLHHVGYIWFVVGAGGFLFRIVQLVLTKDPMTALIWAVKILTDPFHDIALYYKSPLHLEPQARFSGVSFRGRRRGDGFGRQPHAGALIFARLACSRRSGEPHAFQTTFMRPDRGNGLDRDSRIGLCRRLWFSPPRRHPLSAPASISCPTDATRPSRARA